MSRLLTKRELKYIAPAVIYGWEIQKTINFVNGYWNGDHLSPVRTGKMSDKLTDDGYFERVNLMTMFTLRASDKARAMTCRRCYRGGVSLSALLWFFLLHMVAFRAAEETGIYNETFIF